MPNYVYAPGQDRQPSTPNGSASYTPANGAGGVFAEYLQGFTPKYAVNNGFRSDLFRNTLSRLMVRVDAAEMNLFLASVTDQHTQNQLVPRLVGNPTPRQQNRTSGGASAQDPSTRANQTLATNGYLDFFIQQASMPLQEKVDIKETLADNYVAFFFGQQPPVWSFSGWLMNTVQDDQATNFLRLYLEILRGTQLARRQKIINLKIDSYLITGAMIGVNYSLVSSSEICVPFAFQLLVKRIDFINYTIGWVPTRAFTAFAADPNAVPHDGRRHSTKQQLAIAAQIPVNTQEVAPVPNESVDNRVNEAPIPVDPSQSPDFLSFNSSAPVAQSSTWHAPTLATQNPDVTAYSSQPETLNYTPLTTP